VTRLRSPWLLVLASLMFLVGSACFLDDTTYKAGAWLFIGGSAMFLAHSLAISFDRS
jgi:hypothetical protein